MGNWDIEKTIFFIRIKELKIYTNIHKFIGFLYSVDNTSVLIS